MFRTWCEARVLWDCVVRATPGLVAVVLMPNHLHLVHPVDVRRRLAGGLGAYVRWRNARRHEAGQVFDPLPDAWPLADDQKIRRYVKYTHLNPSRAGIIRDPLLWPFSTHRDRCGLAEPAVVPRARDVARFHRYVSSDPHVRVEGTDLPVVKLEVREPRLVLQAVSAVTRTCLDRLKRRGRARSLYLRAARELCPTATYAAIGDLVNVTKLTAIRAAARPDPAVAMVAQVVGDPRFPALDDRLLRWGPARYRDE
jgi:hypothetical protein